MATKKKKVEEPEIERDAALSITIKTAIGEMDYNVTIPNHYSNVTDRNPQKIFSLIFSGLRRQFPQVKMSDLPRSSQSNTSE